VIFHLSHHNVSKKRMGWDGNLDGKEGFFSLKGTMEGMFKTLKTHIDDICKKKKGSKDKCSWLV
jgi:hypothetical protein